MVGNDVVDLRDPDADPATLNPGFDRRVFAKAELLQLAESADPVARRWKLWAAKESAYKALVRRAPNTVFSPIRFRVALERVRCEQHTQVGLVHSDGGICRVHISLRDGAVHAIARTVVSSDDYLPGYLPDLPDYLPDHLPDDVLHDFARVESDRPEMLSHAVRRLARRAIGARLGCGDLALEIGREGRIPLLLLDGERQHADLSLSHHGRVVAFVFAPRPNSSSEATLLRKAS